MKLGDAVKVRMTWAYDVICHRPSRRWFLGYKFVRLDGQDVVVEKVGSIFAGVETRHAVEDVRPQEQ